MKRFQTLVISKKTNYDAVETLELPSLHTGNVERIKRRVERVSKSSFCSHVRRSILGVILGDTLARLGASVRRVNTTLSGGLTEKFSARLGSRDFLAEAM